MAESHPGHRIFFLGAGFSRPAGLPLATELFPLIKNNIENRYGLKTQLHRDLDEYLDYRKSCLGISATDQLVDFEQFMSYLDIEHYLGLRGSKTWSDEGNESQLMMRKAIGQIIHERTPNSDKLPDVYKRFAECLSTHDIVLTTNYDIVLERALEHVGKPYRLFPHRFKTIGRHINTVVSDVEEVVVLKLHGSVDWFYDRHYLDLKNGLTEQGLTKSNLHTVFDDPERYGAEPIVSGPRSPDDPLLHIHRLKKVDNYYEGDTSFNAPFILSPSAVKFVYASPILDLWKGWGRAGGYNLGISVIGFSLPEHDEYIKIVLYQMISNYYSWWDEKLLRVLKQNVRLVDFRTDSTSVNEYKKNYSFLDSDRVEYMFEGFSEEAVQFLFKSPR